MLFVLLVTISNVDESQNLVVSNTSNVISPISVKADETCEISDDEEVFYTFYFGEDIPFEEERSFSLNSSFWKQEYKGVKEAIRTMMEKYG